MWKQRRKRELFALLSGSAVGLMAFFNTLTWMKHASVMSGGIQGYQLRDFWNVAFITDQFDQYPYINKQCIEVLFMPFLFYVLGIWISIVPFFEKQASYRIFVAMRCKNNQAVKKQLVMNHITSVSTYVMAYLAAFHVMAYIKCPFLFGETFILTMIIYGISRVLLFLAFRSLIFFIWMNNRNGFAFFAGILMLILLFLMDTNLNNIHLVLFHPYRMFLDNIIQLFMFLGIFFCCCKMKKMKI